MPDESTEMIRRGMAWIEEQGQAAWTRIAPEVVEAGRAALGQINRALGDTYQFAGDVLGVPALGRFAKALPGMAESYSPEQRALEERRPLGEQLVTGVVAGVPSMLLGPAGEANDANLAVQEAARAGAGPGGQALAGTLAAAPMVAGPLVGKVVGGWLGGGTAEAAVKELGEELRMPPTIPAPPPLADTIEAGDEFFDSLDRTTHILNEARAAGPEGLRVRAQDALLDYKPGVPLERADFQIYERPDYVLAKEAIEQDIPPEIKTAVEQYAGMWYEDINKVYREGVARPNMPNADKAIRTAGKRVEEYLNRAVAEGLTVPGDVVRGVHLPQEAVDALMNSDNVVARSFMSTSLDPQIAKQFARPSDPGGIPVLFRVKQTTGVPVGTGEAELLLRPGTAFRKVGGQSAEIEGRPGYIIDLEEVGKDPSAAQAATAAGAFAAGTTVYLGSDGEDGEAGGAGLAAAAVLGGTKAGRALSRRALAAVERAAPVSAAIREKAVRAIDSETADAMSHYANMGYKEGGKNPYLETAFKEIPPLPGEVYRGINIRPDELKQLKPGFVMRRPSYQSTSIDEDVALNFATDGPNKPVVLRIDQRSGIPLAGKQSEAEVLLPRGIALEVVSREVADGVTFIHMREVD
jgi:hypothetical protein